MKKERLVKLSTLGVNEGEWDIICGILNINLDSKP